MPQSIPPTPAPEAEPDFLALQGDERFVRLRRRHRRFVFSLSAAFLLWYLIYVVLADYAHEFMSIKVLGSINLGLVLGLLQFVTTFAITTWYVSYANRKLDPIGTEIREEIESGTDPAASAQAQNGASA
ncbi:DUF485 domain-containing protein [Acaricomes phytoseiuli]|uniref:DUF485 domain-containing protein n=1 Tax=Acaricomes phytoseiuli TaxID=291968 RepID=UPI0003767FFF|nr:DUF485 domain-containing protein [Acaricomes phytoseiuli]